MHHLYKFILFVVLVSLYAARHLRTRRRKHRRNQKRAYLGINTSNKEAGMYIDLKINDLQTKFLVDTGFVLYIPSSSDIFAHI
jgi:hypothetical protein